MAKTTNTSTHHMSSCYAEGRPSHNHIYTVDHNFGYRSKKFIRTWTESSAHAHGSEIRGGNFNLFKTSVGCTRIGTVGRYSQVCKWTSDGDPRTGTFHETWVTMGDTVCSVKGVSEIATDIYFYWYSISTAQAH